jgi:CubicO group peptidase (beta-lactamase class C family)
MVAARSIRSAILISEKDRQVRAKPMMTFPYEHPVECETVNVDEQRLRAVVERFRAQQSSGLFPGGQLVLRRHGKLVLDEACGIARGLRPGEGREPAKVESHTPFPVLSAGKPLAAVAVALLEDRGMLDADAPVSTIIPGFGSHGKGEITVLDVLTHRAGILLPELVGNPRLWGDRKAVLSHLVNARPTYKRGTFAYMAYEYGWILSEIVSHVDQRTLAEFIAAELSIPLQLPGLAFGLGRRDIGSLAYSYWLGKDKVMVGGINVAEDFEGRNNSAVQFNSMNPAVSLVTDAASLAAFYEFLVNGGVTPKGNRLISERTLRKYITRNFIGWERNSKALTAVGRGFILGAFFPTIYGWWNSGGCFGHPGGFSSLAFGDIETGIAAAMVTNGNQGFMEMAKRFMPLAHGLRKACH